MYWCKNKHWNPYIPIFVFYDSGCTVVVTCNMHFKYSLDKNKYSPGVKFRDK